MSALLVVLSTLTLCLAALDSVCAAGAATVPTCDANITSKMSEFYPSGIPTNIIKSIQSNGRYSYVVVSKIETQLMGFLTVHCIGISMPEDHTAQVSYKLSLVPSGFLKSPLLKQSFKVKEEDGVLIQQDGMEYKLYVLYFSEAGVIFTYRCCDECTGTKPNVGIAVADRRKDEADTKAALAAAKAKMAELGLDKEVVELSNCS